MLAQRLLLERIRDKAMENPDGHLLFLTSVHPRALCRLVPEPELFSWGSEFMRIQKRVGLHPDRLCRGTFDHPEFTSLFQDVIEGVRRRYRNKSAERCLLRGREMVDQYGFIMDRWIRFICEGVMADDTDPLALHRFLLIDEQFLREAFAALRPDKDLFVQLAEDGERQRYYLWRSCHPCMERLNQQGAVGQKFSVQLFLQELRWRFVTCGRPALEPALRRMQEAVEKMRPVEDDEDTTALG
mgnify:CR=1 FL=1